MSASLDSTIKLMDSERIQKELKPAFEVIFHD